MEFSYQTSQNQNQKQKQSQRLILSARMKESLKILQMSLPELHKMVEAEILENPVLEYDGQVETPETEREPLCEHARELRWLSKEVAGHRYDFESSVPDRDEDCNPLASVSQEPTFRNFLLKQLSEVDVDPATAEICRYIIESLDEKGYLRESVEEIASALNLRKTEAVRRALVVVKQMDPPGVGASNLRECLTIQAGRLPGIDPAVFPIINQYLKLLAENKIKEISRRLNLAATAVQKCCDTVRKLNPIPSSGFNTETCEKYVLPEATVKSDECGNLNVESCHDDMQRLFINPIYFRMVESTENADVRKYLKDKIKRASSLLDDISGRKKTILRIIELVVKQQPRYFKSGRSFLEPMTMKSLAKQLGLNESTVSRAIQDKFILCPLGTVPLKALFAHSACTGQNGSTVSPSMVKEKIKDIIQTENQNHPFSDQEIASQLQKSNIDVARRTVAKYREGLAIPSMAKRKIP